MIHPLWAVNAPPIAFPPLEGDASADVCVIGLGGSGLACITELLGAGVSVVGIDAGMVGGGAAGRNGGFLLGGLSAFHHGAAAAHGRSRAVHAYRLTLRELSRIAAETPEGVRLTGSLRIAASAAEEVDCRDQLAAMQADGLPAEWHEGVEGRGLLFPRDGTFQPLLRCRTLARRAAAGGALLHEATRAIAVERGRVRTAAGTVHAGSVIVAVDGRLEALVPELRGQVRTARLQMIGTAPAPEVFFSRPVYTRYGLDYWQQLPDARIALGGFRDVGGEQEWTLNAEPSALVQAALERCLRERLGVRAEVTHRWAAAVSYSTDGLPVVGEVRPGIWVAGGYSGTGNVIGALCGRALAQLVTTGTTSLLI